MRAVVQRVARARVDVDGETVGAIERGLLVLLGVGEDDTDTDGAWMAAKIAGLRIFEDDAERMNLSVGEAGGAVLLVSQFTLYGDCRKGRRPSFIKAKHPDVAAPMVDAVADALRADGLHVEMGRFGAHMDVDLLNDGPVTLLLDSTKLF